MKYKIYGTSENVETRVVKEPNPNFNHQMIIPITYVTIFKMMRIPFIIELWNKGDKGDQLLGVLKISLDKIPRTVLTTDLSRI